MAEKDLPYGPGSSQVDGVQRDDLGGDQGRLDQGEGADEAGGLVGVGNVEHEDGAGAAGAPGVGQSAVGLQGAQRGRLAGHEPLELLGVATRGGAADHQETHASTYGWKPDSVQRWNTSIFSGGQAPSQGIVPLRRRSRMPAACAWTSACDHRSKANVMDMRSCSRNSGLTCAAKLTGSSGPGNATGASSAMPACCGAGGPGGPQSHA